MKESNLSYSNKYVEFALNRLEQQFSNDGFEQFCIEAEEAMDRLVESIDLIPFEEKRDIILIFSGKSRFVAKCIWEALVSRLRSDHPIKRNSREILLNDIENAALYGKYSEKYYPEKYQEQKKLVDSNYNFLVPNTVHKPENPPIYILFEEHSNSEYKAFFTLSNLRKLGIEIYVLILSAMPISKKFFIDEDDIQLPDDANNLSNYILIGSRSNELHNAMSNLAMIRSIMSADVLDKQKKYESSDRKIRQKLRDLMRKISKDLSIKR